MGGRFRVMMWIGVAGLALLAVVYLLFDYYASPGWEAERAAKRRAREEGERFAAVFDSLYHARLLPTAWRKGVFTKTCFDSDFEEWTLTIAATDWRNRGTASKKDLAATLWVAYRGARGQAGGDPDAGRLVIEDSDGNRVAVCSADGVRILR